MRPFDNLLAPCWLIKNTFTSRPNNRHIPYLIQLKIISILHFSSLIVYVHAVLILNLLKTFKVMQHFAINKDIYLYKYKATRKYR